MRLMMMMSRSLLVSDFAIHIEIADGRGTWVNDLSLQSGNSISERSSVLNVHHNLPVK